MINNRIFEILLVHLVFIFFVNLSIAPSDTAYAMEEIRGEVRNSGNPPQRKTSLLSQNNPLVTDLCEGGQRFSISQLPSSVVTAKGQFKFAAGQREKCLLAESYVINEIAPGRPAIVGKLKQIDKKSYAIFSEEGRVWKLSEIAPGVKGMAGSIIVADLIADSAISGETTWIVVRIFRKP